jgi:hypothetical protein
MASRRPAAKVGASSASLATLVPADPRSWIVTIVAVAVAYLLVSRGFFLFFAQWQIPLFVGVLAAMIASTYVQAGIAATLTLVGLQLASPPLLISRAPLGATGWLLSIVLIAAASVGVGWLRAQASVPRRWFAVGVSSLLVVWVLANFWAPLFAGGFPLTGYGPLRAEVIRANPVPKNYVNDDAIYRRVFYLMHGGTPYYQAFRQAWDGLTQTVALPNSVTAYRLPTMYWLWNLLPPDAFLVVIVYLVFASAGCVAAAFITGQLVGVRFAPLAATALAVYAMGSAITVYVTYIDLPAACIALIGVALFVRAALTKDARYLWAAAAVLAGAALTREILAYLIGLAALSALLEPAAERLRKATPWLVALAVFGAGYAWHSYSVMSLISTGSGVLSYAKGSPAFAIDAIRRFSDVMTAGGLLLPILFVLGVAGAWGAHKRTGLPFAAFAAAALVVPILAMMKLGNPGIDAAGLQVNYWGNLVVPLGLALWPVSALLLPRGAFRER